MSILVDIVMPDIARIDGLVEALGSWGSETLPHDPPRYRFGALTLTLEPLPASLGQALTSGLRGVVSCLTLPMSICGGPLVLRSVHTSELFDALMAVAPERDGCFVLAASRVSPYRG